MHSFETEIDAQACNVSYAVIMTIESMLVLPFCARKPKVCANIGILIDFCPHGTPYLYIHTIVTTKK